MSQYGGQQAYGQQQQAPQYGGQQTAPSQYGAQQDPAQYGGQQDPSQYGGQQDSEQYGGQQDPSQYGQQDPSQFGGQQDPSSHSGGEDPSKSQYGQQSKPASGTNELANGHKAETERKEPNGMKHDEKKGDEKDESKHTHEGEEKNSQNHAGNPNKALTKSDHSLDMQKGADTRANAGRKYHHTHMNALHHMGKAAANGFTPEHIDSLLHLLTYAGGTLANTHGLAPAAPVEADE